MLPPTLALLTLLLVLTLVWHPPAASADDTILTGVSLVAPVNGGVLRAFVAPLSAYGPGHRGVDLAASVGDPVAAGAAGVVTFAGRVAGRGVITVNDGSGVDTTYEPVTASVARGDRVRARQSSCDISDPRCGIGGDQEVALLGRGDTHGQLEPHVA